MNTAQYEKVIEFLFDKYPRIPLFVYGHSGIGKTEIAESVAKRRGVPTVYLNATGMESPDLTGLPYHKDNFLRFACPLMFEAFSKSETGFFIIEPFHCSESR